MIHLKKILLPTDFSPPSQNAMRYAISFAEEYTTKVYLFHVIEDLAAPTLPYKLGFSEEMGVTIRKEIQSCVAKRFEEMLPEAREGFEVVPFIGNGVLHEEIIRAAQQLDVDLVVMGTHGRSAITHVMLGSTAERVVHEYLSEKDVKREIGKRGSSVEGRKTLK